MNTYHISNLFRILNGIHRNVFERKTNDVKERGQIRNRFSWIKNRRKFSKNKTIESYITSIGNACYRFIILVWKTQTNIKNKKTTNIQFLHFYIYYILDVYDFLMKVSGKSVPEKVIIGTIFSERNDCFHTRMILKTYTTKFLGYIS